MARQTLTKTTAPGCYAGTSTAVTMTAADTSNYEEFTLTGKELLIIYNSGGSSYTWTATSVDDSFGRSEDITTESIAAGAIRVFGPISTAGWQQTDGKFYMQASNTAVKFGIIVLP